MQGGFEHFLSACSLLRFEVTAQPLLKARHSKAYRYATMLQRFDRHTPLPIAIIIIRNGKKYVKKNFEFLVLIFTRQKAEYQIDQDQKRQLVS